MKKIILLSFVLLCSHLVLAETAVPSETVTPNTITTQTDSSLESIARNIDRRLVYFNKYKLTNDIESLAKLVSEENKDFYINFMKYMKASPVFSLKRDMTEKIVKTPTGDYVASVTMLVNGKTNKVSVTFIEQMSDQGNKWLISNSNLHIQIPLPKNGNTLTSNALSTQKDTKNTHSTSMPTTGKKPETTTELESKAVATIPVITKTTSPIPTTQPIIPQKTSKGMGVMEILGITALIIISLGVFILWILMLIDCIKRDFDHKTVWIVLLILFGLPTTIAYYFIIKRHGGKGNIAATTTLVASTVALSELTASPESTTTTISNPINSNVTVSTVEEIHTNVSSSESSTSNTTGKLDENIATSGTEDAVVDNNGTSGNTPAEEENTSSPSSIEGIPSETIQVAPTAEEVSAPQEESTSDTVITEDAVVDNNGTSGDTPAEEENTPSPSSVEGIPSETIQVATTAEEVSAPHQEESPSSPLDQVIEKENSADTAVANIFNQNPVVSSEGTTSNKSLDEIIQESSHNSLFGEAVEGSQPHSLFDSIFNPTPPKPESHGLFENILNSGS